MNQLRLTEEQLAALLKKHKPRVIRPLGKEYEPLPDGPPVRVKEGKKKDNRTTEERRKHYAQANAARRERRKGRTEYKTSVGEAMLIQQLELAGIKDWVREHRFLQERLFRLDFAWPQMKLGVEIEGGTFSGGRHVRGEGFAKDCEKHNLLALHGWHLLRYTTEMLKTGIAVQQITDMLVGLQMGMSGGGRNSPVASPNAPGRTESPNPACSLSVTERMAGRAFDGTP